MATTRALRTRGRRLHRSIAATGTCCLVGEVGGKLRPRRVSDALGQTMGMPQPVDRPGCTRRQIALVDDAAARLMGEGASSPGAALMDTGPYQAPRGPLRQVLLGTAQAACLSAGPAGGDTAPTHKDAL